MPSVIEKDDNPELLLVIDDDATYRLCVSTCLTDLAINNNMYIMTAGSIGEAEKIIADTKPKLIITDWNLTEPLSLFHMATWIDGLGCDTVVITSSIQDVPECVQYKVNKMDSKFIDILIETCSKIIEKPKC